MAFDEQIKALAPASLEAPEHFNAIQRHASEFETSSRAATAELTARFRDSNEKVQSVMQDAESLQDAVLDLAEQYTAAAASAEEHVSLLANSVRSSLANLTSELNSLSSEYMDFSVECASAKDASDATTSELVTNHQRWRGEVAGHQQHSAEEAVAATQQMEEFQSTANSSAERCREEIESLKQTLGELQEALEQKQEEIATLFDDQWTEHETAVNDLLESVVTAQTNELLDRAQESIETQLRDLVDTALAELDKAIDEIVESITEGDDDTRELRELLQPAIDELEELVEPLKNAMERVSDFISDFT